MAFSVGETLQSDKYRLDALLDTRQWGMSFLATLIGLDQQVLIKTFQAAHEGPTQAQVESYIDYAQKLARFHHPHLARVISAFEEDGTACMVSEFIQGQPLSQIIRDQPLDESTAIAYIRQVAHGLHALHRHGLLHLNLSPSRILKRPGEANVVLVGLNSRFASHPAERQLNPYLAFEQHQTPVKVSLASEIYGVAATLYALVTGQAPIAACDRGNSPLLLPHQLRPEISPALESAILRGMAPDPRDRPQRMKDWIKMLPQLPQVNAQTTLQVPSAWKVKLPAFHDAGVEEAVSAVIAPKASPELQTTLQVASPKEKVAIPDPTPSPPGHPELDSILAEFSEDSTPDVEKTTLQVIESPPVRDETSASPKPISQPIPAPAVDAAPVAIATSQASVVTTPSVPGALKTAQPSADMTATLRRRSSQFPKWTLFWCALIAACGGLAAGLWFRMQLSRQFVSKPTPVRETTPLDDLRTLSPKEEQFLPTQTSVIPEEKPENSGEFYDESVTESTYESPTEEYPLESRPNTSPSASEFQEPDPWNAREGQGFSSDPVDPVTAPVTPDIPPQTSPESFGEPLPYETETGAPSLESGEVYPVDPDLYLETPSDESFTSDSRSFDPNSGTF